MVRAICGVQLIDKEMSMDLMFMLDLNENIDQVGCGKQCSLVSSCVEKRGRSCLEKAIRF